MNFECTSKKAETFMSYDLINIILPEIDQKSTQSHIFINLFIV